MAAVVFLWRLPRRCPFLTHFSRRGQRLCAADAFHRAQNGLRRPAVANAYNAVRSGQRSEHRMSVDPPGP